MVEKHQYKETIKIGSRLQTNSTRSSEQSNTVVESNGPGAGTSFDKDDSSVVVQVMYTPHELEAISEINEFEEDNQHKKRQNKRNDQGLTMRTANNLSDKKIPQ